MLTGLKSPQIFRQEPPTNRDYRNACTSNPMSFGSLALWLAVE